MRKVLYSHSSDRYYNKIRDRQKLNQLHLAKREIRMVRDLETGAKKSTVLEQVEFLSTSGDFYQALIEIYLNSSFLLSKSSIKCYLIKKCLY